MVLRVFMIMLLMVSLVSCGKTSSSDTLGMMKLTPFALLPDEQRLRAGLRSDVDDAVVEKLLEYYRQRAGDMPQATQEGASYSPENTPESLETFMTKIQSDLAPPERTQVVVHASSVTDIIAYTPGTSAYEEFPGGAVEIAELYLNPDIMFYEVEFVEPSEEYGMKYHLLYWDGHQWSMIGAAWRKL